MQSRCMRIFLSDYQCLHDAIRLVLWTNNKRNWLNGESYSNVCSELEVKPWLFLLWPPQPLSWQILQVARCSFRHTITIHGVAASLCAATLNCLFASVWMCSCPIVRVQMWMQDLHPVPFILSSHTRSRTNALLTLSARQYQMLHLPPELLLYSRFMVNVHLIWWWRAHRMAAPEPGRAQSQETSTICNKC